MGRFKTIRKQFRSYLKFAHRRLAPFQRRPGVLFIGYAEGNLGLGETIRSDVLAARDARVPFAIYPFNLDIETRLVGPFLAEHYDVSHRFGVNVIEVAADRVPNVFRNVDHRITSDSYNILRTFWELPRAPAEWRSMLKGIDEIWAPNAFCAAAFADVFPRTITIMPPSIDTDLGPFEGRAAFDMDLDRFYFLFTFDYFSSPHRKNPEAVLRAFQRAFPNRADRVALVMKSIGNDQYFPGSRAVLQQAAHSDSRVIFLEQSLRRIDILNLIHSSDAYVSLHRAEGFGLGMAEAMSFGRPVIGTDFSGNTDFLTPKSGFPISYALRPVEHHEYHWAAGQSWAEPDINEAALVMRWIVDNPHAAQHRAQKGQALIRTKYHPSVVGQAIRHRIEKIELQQSKARRA